MSVLAKYRIGVFIQKALTKFSLKSPSSIVKLFVCIAVVCVTIIYERTGFASAPVVGLWRFNEGTGTNITDSSGFNNNGTLTGENGNVPAWATGQSGFRGALRFTNDGLYHAWSWQVISAAS